MSLFLAVVLCTEVFGRSRGSFWVSTDALNICRDYVVQIRGVATEALIGRENVGPGHF